MKEANDTMKAYVTFHKATPLQKKQYHFLKALMLKFIYEGHYIDQEVIKPALPVMDEIENCMQKVLGLPVDKNSHRYMWELPGCTCPKLDNMERFGTGEYIWSEDCPYHGIASKEDKK